MQVDNRCGCVALPAMLLKCHASSHLSFSHPGASGLSFNVPAWSGESPPHPGASCMSKCLSALGRAACSAHVMPSTLVQVGQCKPVITTQVLRKTWHCRPFATDQYAKTSTRRMRSRPDVKQKATAVEGAKLPSSAGPDSQRMYDLYCMCMSVVRVLLILHGPCSPKSLRRRQEEVDRQGRCLHI